MLPREHYIPSSLCFYFMIKRNCRVYWKRQEKHKIGYCWLFAKDIFQRKKALFWELIPSWSKVYSPIKTHHLANTAAVCQQVF